MIDRGSANDVLVIIPTWNEEQTVGDVVDEVRSHGYSALVVDDGSTDRSAELAERAGATVLRLPVNLGVGGALRCGFRYAIDRGLRDRRAVRRGRPARSGRDRAPPRGDARR